MGKKKHRQTTKHRKQQKKEKARRKARQQSVVQVDVAEPEEVKQMLEDAGIAVEETQISPARRAFQNEGY